MTNRYKTCRCGHRLYETWPYEALRSFNPFNTSPEFTNKLWQCRFTTYLCSAQKTPRATILSQRQWVDLLRIFSLSNTARSLWLSVVFQSIRCPSVTEQNTTHANPKVVQVRHAIFPCFTKLYYLCLKIKLKAEENIPDAIEYCFTIWEQKQAGTTMGHVTAAIRYSVIQIENMLSWISRYTWHNRIFVSSQANISSF